MLYRGIARLFLYLLFLFPTISTASPLDKKNNFLVISDIHLDIATTHTMEINPSGSNALNDLDRPTFQNLLLEIRENIMKDSIAEPQFIIILGDINGHARPTADSSMKNESVVFGLLKKNFPNTPIFYTYGNNDSLVVKYGPFVDPDPHESCPLKSPYDIAK